MEPSQTYVLSKKEKRTRKTWLFCSLALLIFHALSICMYSFSLSQSQANQAGEVGLIISSASSFLVILGIYFSSYRGSDTKFITVLLLFTIGSSLTSLRNTIDLFIETIGSILGMELGPANQEVMGRGGAIFVLIIMATGAWWYFLSWKLRSINVAINKAKKQPTILPLESS